MIEERFKISPSKILQIGLITFNYCHIHTFTMAEGNFENWPETLHVDLIILITTIEENIEITPSEMLQIGFKTSIDVANLSCKIFHIIFAFSKINMCNINIYQV